MTEPPTSSTLHLLHLGLRPELATAVRDALPMVTLEDGGTDRGVMDRISAGVDLLVLNVPSTTERTDALLAQLAAIPPTARPRLVCLIEPSIDPAQARRLISDCGAVQLLVHPVDPDELAEKIRAILGLEAADESRSDAGPGQRTRAAVAALWTRFEGVLRSRVGALEAAALADLDGTLEPEARALAEREAHKLAGSLGTFGLSLGTRLAREAEAILGAEGEPGSAAERLQQIATVLGVLVDRGPRVIPAADASAPRVLLVDADPQYLNGLALAATAQGFLADTARSLAEARASLLLHRPQVAVVDLSLDDGDLAGHTVLRALAAFSAPVPVIALTPRGILNDRVEAARLGARTVFQKPVSAQRVVAEVVTIVQQLFNTRSKILAVDDDPGLLASLSALLEEEGLDVATLADPLEFWNMLEAVNPELIILDVDMPAITGIELCRVIRSDPRWCTLPILFLTARTDAPSVHRIFAAGADDYVTKPIVGPELVTRIRNRLERLALLRKLSDFDALTGIPNRRRSIELIEQLERLAERQQEPLCFALLDVDGFKKINDSYGHGAGDEVLHALAEFLERQFRGEDVVGRWGGEEFALGLFGIRRAAATRRIRQALRDFAAEEFHGRHGETFRVTVSAGVAEFPIDGLDVEGLYRAADEALYRAKAAGRDRVLEAGGGPTSSLRAL